MLRTVRVLGEGHTARRFDRLQSPGSIRAGPGENHADGLRTQVVRQSLQEGIDWTRRQQRESQRMQRPHRNPRSAAQPPGRSHASRGPRRNSRVQRATQEPNHGETAETGRGVGYRTLDRGGIIREINLTGASMLGNERARLSGTPLWSHLDAGQARALHSHIEAVQRSGERRTRRFRLTPSNRGHAVDLRLESEPARGDDEAVCLTVMIDVTEQRHLVEQLKEREQALSHLALHDPLTGLANRSLVSDRLDRANARGQRTDEQLAVLFIDLDRFKLINDSFGHPSGDEVLKDVAARLKEQIRKDDTVSRIGGDEFLILIASVDSPDAAAVARKLITLLRRAYAGPRGEIALTVSIGISVCPDDGTVAEKLVRQADTAMYMAKQDGRNTFRFCAADTTKQAFDRIFLRTGLAHAVERGERALFYQPQLALDARRTPGIEAFLRWMHPVLGCLAPRALSRACRGDRVDPRDLRTALTQRKRWQAEGLDEGTRIKITLSR